MRNIQDLDLEDSESKTRDENADANGSIKTVEGDVDQMLENVGIDTGEVLEEEQNVYDQDEEYGGHFNYREDDGAVKSALGLGYVLGANPGDDPRSFD